jgi:hypothetical protein|tara:strand:- start:72 stop:575 length:504 start_codon:yes stop_codon:yes gene_type:complete
MKVRKKADDRYFSHIKKGVESYYPPKTSPIKDMQDLGRELRKLGVTPGEALKIVRRAKLGETTRFNWKMLRFTMFVWERYREFDHNRLGKKIDTIRNIVNSRKFEMFYNGYFPELKLDQKAKDKEVKIFNKLIAEAKQQPYFKEGYYYYEGTKKHIPQSKLDKILSK